MTVFCKRALAFPKPDPKPGTDPMFKLAPQEFGYDVPEWLKDNDSFKHCVETGNIIIIDKPQNIDKAIKDPNPKREAAQQEKSAAELGVLDGGEAAKG